MDLPTSNEDIKTNFLNENENFQEINVESFEDDCLNDVTSEDEVWMVQCPKSISLEELNKQKIKLPGRSHHNQIETLAVKFPENLNAAFGCKIKNEYCLKVLPIEGSIIVREKLKLIKVEEPEPEDDSSKKSNRVMLPKGLKVRHPLHGADYEKISNIPESIQDRLKKVDIIKIKKKKKSMVRNSIKNESDIYQLLEDKSPNDKRKKKSDANGSYTKKIKIEETIDDNLQWINNL